MKQRSLLGLLSLVVGRVVSDDNITDADDDDPELLIATVAPSRIAAGKVEPEQVRHRSKVAR